MSKSRRTFSCGVFITVGALIALVIACSGGDSKPKITLDPQKADQLAHAALLSERDLPGGGWVVSKVDEFDDSDAFGGIPACEKASAIEKTIKDNLDPKRVARSEKELERSSSKIASLTVELKVYVYQDSDGIAGPIKDFNAFIKTGQFSDCASQVFKKLAGPRVNVTTVTPGAVAPAGGYVTAFEVDTGAGGLIRAEAYTWQFGNAVATVEFTGPPDEVNTDLVRPVLDKMRSALDRAAGPNPPTAVAAVVATPTRSPAARATSASGVRNVGTLGSLNSYRYTLRIEGAGGPFTALVGQVGGLTGTPSPGGSQQVVMEVKGAFVKPDRAQETISIGGLTVTSTTIGGQQWSTLGTIISGPKTKTPSPNELSFVGPLWDDSFINLVSTFGCSTTLEQVNGVKARKCGFDRATFDQIKDFVNASLGANADYKSFSTFAIEAWLADPDGYPVRFSVDLAGKDSKDLDFQMKLTFDITDVNSSSIKIDPPR